MRKQNKHSQREQEHEQAEEKTCWNKIGEQEKRSEMYWDWKCEGMRARL